MSVPSALVHRASLLAALAAFSGLPAGGRVQAGAPDRTLDIYWIDSQGGGSTLVVTPNNESILIDTGNPGGRDAGRIHHVVTQVAQLSRIDHLIVTHFHIDHFGGAAELAQRIPIGTVYDNGLPTVDPDGNQDPTWPQKSRAYREMKCARRVVITPGTTLPLLSLNGGPTIQGTFLAARQKFAAGPPAGDPNACLDGVTKPKDTSDNANSVVTLFQFGPFRFFNGGDLTWNTEAALTCPTLQLGSVDVYQVNHHGLDVSNNPRLLRALAPTVAVFNNGPHKGAAPAVAEALRGLPSTRAVYQVHRNLDAAAANSPAPFLANNGEAGGNWIRLSVAPDGTSYTVTVPATGHQERYLTRR